MIGEDAGHPAAGKMLHRIATQPATTTRDHGDATFDFGTLHDALPLNDDGKARRGGGNPECRKQAVSCLILARSSVTARLPIQVEMTPIPR